ncbi:hypothetical protein VTJ83DRAFT_4377 [Remersonia thermophila]|uniref:Uncharacterized protein n=1 Tax=Remersonia thermophila TaxID=72144 RepID=A0ABR4D9R2_9PEZI
MEGLAVAKSPPRNVEVTHASLPVFCCPRNWTLPLGAEKGEWAARNDSSPFPRRTALRFIREKTPQTAQHPLASSDNVRRGGRVAASPATNRSLGAAGRADAESVRAVVVGQAVLQHPSQQNITGRPSRRWLLLDGDGDKKRSAGASVRLMHHPLCSEPPRLLSARTLTSRASSPAGRQHQDATHANVTAVKEAASPLCKNIQEWFGQPPANLALSRLTAVADRASPGTAGGSRRRAACSTPSPYLLIGRCPTMLLRTRYSSQHICAPTVPCRGA